MYWFEERWCWWQIEPHIACLLKAVVLLVTLYAHEKGEHNRKQFLEILFLLVSFRLLISDLRCISVTILILCFLFEERWCWWWIGCASREIKQVLVFFFFIKSFLFICIFIHIFFSFGYILPIPFHYSFRFIYFNRRSRSFKSL